MQKNSSKNTVAQVGGLSYSVEEARRVVKTNKELGQYHAELMTFLCDEVDRLQTENKAFNPTPINKEKLLFGRNFAENLLISCFSNLTMESKDISPEVKKALVDSEEISLVLVANGIPMDAIPVCEEWSKQVDAAVERKAVELVKDKFGESKRRIEDMMSSVENHIRDELMKASINPNDCAPF